MKHFYKLLFSLIFLIGFSGHIQAQIISQYTETNSGTSPKGIEIWNNTGSTLDFSTNTLDILKGSNGGTPSSDVTVTSGTLAPGDVMVIGTTNMGTYLTDEGLTSVTFVDYGFNFNGDDALVVEYGGVVMDVIGEPGSDPGSSWSGNGVSTANQNIELLAGISSGDTDGWTDPSERFATVSTDPVNDLTGFGVAPPEPGSPALNLSSSSFSNLNYDEGSGPSASDSLTLSGSNLDGTDVVISAPANFEISETIDSGYGSSVTLTTYDGSSAKIYLRLQASLTDGDYSGVITVSGGGTDDQTISLSGSVTGPKSTTLPYTEDFASDLGNIYTYNVLGDNREWSWDSDGYAVGNGFNFSGGEDQEDWMILPAFDADAYANPILTFDTWYRYGVDEADGNNYLKLYYSTDYAGVGDPSGATWNELTFTRPSTDQEWESSGNVDLSGISGSSVYVAFEYNYLQGDWRTWQVNNISIENLVNPEFTVNPEVLAGVKYGEGNGPSDTTSFALTGLNLDGSDATVTAPANFEISDTEEGTYGSSVTLSSYDGSETTIWVRLEAGLAQDTYNGDVTISGSGASDVTVAVSGEVTYPWDVVEGFDQFPETGGSYNSGSFDGVLGNTWTYVDARGDGELEGPNVGLRNNSSALLSTTLPNGIAEFSFDYQQMFSNNVNLVVYINGDSVTTVTTDDENGIVKNSGIISTEYYGNFDIEFKQGPGGNQVAIDNFSWVDREGEVAPVGTVVLSGPADEAEDLGLTPEFSWTAAEYAENYTIQISTNSDVSSPAVDEEVATTSFTPSADLSTGTTYYWRVRGTSSGDTGDWSSIRSFTTLPDAPAVVTVTAPADEATDVSVTPMLEWDPATGADSYKVQVSEQSDFSSTAIDSSTTGTSFIIGSPLATGSTFYWRIKAVNAGGESDWSAGTSFTTVVVEPDLPGAVTVTGPVDESTGLSLTPDFSWEAEEFADSYNFQLATDESFSTIVVDSVGISGTAFAVTEDLDNLTEYFWRVRGQNSDGTGSWSAVQSFTTIIEVPAVVALSTPADEAVDVSTTPSLSWGESDRAAEYTVQLSASSDFSTNLVDSVVTSASFDVETTLENDSTYFWRVLAANDGGQAEWSATWSFTTVVDVPAMVTLSGPANEASGVTTTPTLSWTEVSGAAEYTVQFSTSDDFEDVDNVIEETTSETSIEVSEELDNMTQYYWRVQAINAGGAGEWSSTWSFTTIVAAPEAVSLLAPANDGELITVEPEFSWAATQNASEYTFQLSASNSFETPLVDSTFASSDTSFTLAEALDYDTEYFWRVQATNDGGTGDWSATFSFTTEMGTSSELENMPVEFTLNQNYPNPFNPTTNLRFGIPEAAEVRLEVYNMLGQHVSTIVNERKSAGWHTVAFDASSLSSGMYIYRIKAGNFVQTKQMMLIK